MHKQQIKIGDSFFNRMECFMCFHHLIAKENWEFISEETEKVALNEVNHSVYVYIISKKETEIQNNWKEQEEFWIRDMEEVEDWEKIYITPFTEAEYVFLFKQEEVYRFLGLYHIENDELIWQRWERNSEETFSLEKENVRNIIERSKYIWTKVYQNQISKKEIEQLKRYEDLCWSAIIRSDGKACQYIPPQLLNEKAFAQKVLQRCENALPYFSEEIKNDIKMYEKMESIGRIYRDVPLKIRQNQELTIKAMKENPLNIRYADKKLKEDKEIQKNYWKIIQEKSKEGDNFENLYSIVGIDLFGNKVIQHFCAEEKERCTKERIDQYHEAIELVQLIKSEINKEILDYPITMLEKEIFDTELNPIVILIGEKENTISRQIKEKYNQIIEIYREDVKTEGLKLITTNQEKMLDFLRVILYSKTDFKPILEKDKIAASRLDITKYTGSKQELKEQIENMPRCQSPELHLIQIVHSDTLDACLMEDMQEIIENSKKNRYIEAILQHGCKMHGVEVIILRANLKF